MATKKKQARKAPAKKVAAVHRLREGLAKKRREPPHIAEDVQAPQTEFDFTHKDRDASLADLVQAASPSYAGAQYRPEPPPATALYEARNKGIPDNVEISVGSCFIRLTFR